MAIKLETTIQKWNCVSSDVFPSSGISEGSKIHVINTGEKYIYHDGMWEQDLSLVYALSVT